MRFYVLTLILFLGISLQAQEKSPLSEKDFDLWERLQNTQISPEGNFITYEITPGKGDKTLKVMSPSGDELLSYLRGESASISWNDGFVVFVIKPAYDTLRALKRLKTKEKEMPQDSIAIFQTSNGVLTKIAPVIDYKLPKEWEGYLAYRLDEMRNIPDSLKKDEKEVSKKNGYHLILKNLVDYTDDTIYYVKNYEFAKKEK